MGGRETTENRSKLASPRSEKNLSDTSCSISARTYGRLQFKPTVNFRAVLPLLGDTDFVFVRRRLATHVPLSIAKESCDLEQSTRAWSSSNNSGAWHQKSSTVKSFLGLAPEFFTLSKHLSRFQNSSNSFSFVVTNRYSKPVYNPFARIEPIS